MNGEFFSNSQSMVDDMMCSDQDYESEMAMENEREKARQENVRNVLQMIDKCIGPPK